MLKAFRWFKLIAPIPLALGIVGSVVGMRHAFDYWILANTRGYASCFVEDGWVGFEAAAYQPNPEFVLATGAYHDGGQSALRAGETHIVQNWIDFGRGMFRVEVPSWLTLAISGIGTCFWIATFSRSKVGGRGFKIGALNQAENRNV